MAVAIKKDITSKTMNAEQLKRGKEIALEIDDLIGRARKPVEAIEKPDSKFTHLKLDFQVKTSDNSYVNGVFSPDTSVAQELRETINEELNVAFERITRAFEKRIKKLEKEFEQL